MPSRKPLPPPELEPDGPMSIETARLTADVVLIGFRDSEAYVLLIRRRWEPFEGRLALPGGHVDQGEETEDAARRELVEETGLTVRRLSLVGVYAAPGRDPRGRYATWAYVAYVPGLPTPTAGDDAASAGWYPLADVLADADRLAFDHHRIISAAPHPADVHPET